MTTPFRQMQLDSTLSVAVIVTGLAVSWFGYNDESPGQVAARIAAEDSYTVSQSDGRFKMTVTAHRPRDFVPVKAEQLTARTAPERS